MLASGIQQGSSVLHIHVPILFQILFPLRLLYNIEQSSLCYTEGLCWLSILNINAGYFCLSLLPLFLEVWKLSHSSLQAQLALLVIWNLSRNIDLWREKGKLSSDSALTGHPTQPDSPGELFPLPSHLRAVVLKVWCLERKPRSPGTYYNCKSLHLIPDHIQSLRLGPSNLYQDPLMMSAPGWEPIP